MEELSARLNELEQTLLWQSEKLNTLEQTLEKLANPSLMYKRPTSDDYETVAQTLDYLHNNIEGLKGDLLKVAKAV
jgi:chromosome segregation ATPase